jgi:hypothetical protein
MKSTTILSLFILASLFSCNKTKVVGPNLKTYITKYIDKTRTETYNYDAQNNLSSIDYEEASGNIDFFYSYKILKYTSNGSIEEGIRAFKSPKNDNVKITNTYDSEGRLIKSTETNEKTNKMVKYQTLEYSKNQIKLSEYNNLGKLTNYFIYTQSDNGKNYIAIKRYSPTNAVEVSLEYTEFDNKIQYRKLIPAGFTAFPVNTNNSLKFTQDYLGKITNYSYNYEYNSNGFTTKSTSSDGQTYTIEYLKK